MTVNTTNANTPGKRRAADKETKAAIAANVAKRQQEEATAQEHNAKAVIAPKHKAQGNTKPLKVGSGALIGVAQGAMDGQPHTKLAVQEARARELAKQTDDRKGKEMAITFKGPVWATPAEHKALKRVKAKYGPRLETVWADKECVTKDKTAFASQARKKEYERAPVQEQPLAPAKQAKKPTAPKQPRAPKVDADRAYKPGPNAYAGKAGSWTELMVQHTLKHKTTAAATAAYKASKAWNNPDYKQKPLDLRWMDAKGFIKFA